MSLGYDTEPNIVNLNDSSPIRAVLYDKDDAPIPAASLSAVSFVVQKPDKSKTTASGVIDSAGVGTLTYNSTDQVGQYIAVATFTLTNGMTRSTRVDFEVIDPFNQNAPSPSWVIADAAWSKLEDCFDADDEGPYLRDATLNYFNKNKMENFIAEALFDINNQNPPTGLTTDAFAYANSGQTFATPELPLLAQGVLVAVIRHLMRSYVEMPNPVGAQVAWHDRRDYLQRWQTVYQTEYQQYLRILALYKRQFLGLGHSKVLVSSKAGRLIPAPLRTRSVGRGYW